MPASRLWLFLVVPVLEPLATTVNGVVPGLIEDRKAWYDWYDGNDVPVPSQANTTIGAPLGSIPGDVRGGSVVPLQQPVLTARDAGNSPCDVLVAVDKTSSAKGDLYLDPSISVQPNATLTGQFVVQNRTVSSTISHGG